MDRKESEQSSRFREHELDWTPERIGRFWDYYSGQISLDEVYFGFQCGREVIAWTKQKGLIQEPVLDFGSGKGFLLDYLLKDGVADVSGCDFSRESVDHASKALAGRAGFKGCVSITGIPTPYPDQAFGTIFCLEVIEHLNDKTLSQTLREWHRLLRRGGCLVVTTRNDEDLSRGKVLCPECGAIFHRVQHVRSFSIASLSERLRQEGFTDIRAEALLLGDLAPGLFNRVRRMMRRFISPGVKPPNLLAIARKA